MPPTVLLGSQSHDPVPDLRAALEGAGFAVRHHRIGAPASAEFGTVAVALLDVGTDPTASGIQTRRWRAELGDELVPIIWVLPAADPELATLGLESGADVVLTRPLHPPWFIAQVRAAVRLRAAAARLAARASESRMLAEQINRLRDQLDREHATARRMQLALQHRPIPQVGNIRFHVAHRSRGKTGGDFYAVQPLDATRVAFLLGDVTGTGTGASLLGTLLASSLTSSDTTDPGHFLSHLNRMVLQLGLEDTPLVAVCTGIVDTTTGDVAIARAGLLPPVHLQPNGKATEWVVPGPFLNAAETTYPTHTALLQPGHKLLLGTDGVRPDGRPGPGGDSCLLAIATECEGLNGQHFVESVMSRLLVTVQHEDDITLLLVEHLQ